MTDAQARSRIERMVSAASDPTLSDPEIDDLLDLAKRPDPDGNVPHPPRRNATAYGVGDLVFTDPRNGYIYECIVPGTTGGAPPLWPTLTDGEIADGDVTWRNVGISTWVASFDIDRAVAEGWRWKAGKVAAEFDVSVGGNAFQRAQTYAHCIAQASVYAKRVVSSIPVSLPNPTL